MDNDWLVAQELRSTAALYLVKQRQATVEHTGTRDFMMYSGVFSMIDTPKVVG